MFNILLVLVKWYNIGKPLKFLLLFSVVSVNETSEVPCEGKDCISIDVECGDCEQSEDQQNNGMYVL